MIGIAVFCLILSSLTYGESTVLEEKQKLAARLTALLRNHGWQYINHVTVQNISLYPKELFTGIDVFVANETAVVNADNFKKQYVVTVHLLGCVYSNAVLEIVTLFRYILKACTEAKHMLYCQAKAANGRENRVVENQNMRMYPIEILQIVLHLTDTCSLMFEYINSVLMFLIEMIPTSLDISLDISHIKQLIHAVVWLRDRRVSKHARFDPFKGSQITEDNVGKYTTSLYNFFGKSIAMDLAPFELKYCSMPKRTSQPPKYVSKREIVLDLESKISNLIKDVTGMYYTNLGFAYNEETKKTFISDRLNVPSTSTFDLNEEPIDT